MAIINSYPGIGTLTSGDLVLVSDTSKEGNPTKTTSAQSIANLANSTSQYTAYAARLNASSGLCCCTSRNRVIAGVLKSFIAVGTNVPGDIALATLNSVSLCRFL